MSATALLLLLLLAAAVAMASGAAAQGPPASGSAGSSVFWQPAPPPGGADCGAREQVAMLCGYRPKARRRVSAAGAAGFDAVTNAPPTAMCAHPGVLCAAAYGSRCDASSARALGRRFDLGTFQSVTGEPALDTSVAGVPTYECFCAQPPVPPPPIEPLPPCAAGADGRYAPDVWPCANSWQFRVAQRCPSATLASWDGAQWQPDALGSANCSHAALLGFCRRAYPAMAACFTGVSATPIAQEYVLDMCPPGSGAGTANGVARCNGHGLASVYSCDGCAGRRPAASGDGYEACPPRFTNASPTPASTVPAADCGAAGCSGHGFCVPDSFGGGSGGGGGGGGGGGHHCQCVPTWKGAACDVTTDEWEQCFPAPEPLNQDVCVTARFADCVVHLDVHLRNLPFSLFSRTFTASDLKRLVQQQTGTTNPTTELPLGICTPNLLGCSACANFTVSINEQRARGCGSATVSCNGLTLLSRQFSPCWEDTSLVPQCFGGCDDSNHCSGHGECTNGFCECDDDHGGPACAWSCPAHCNEALRHGVCTAGGCSCANGTTHAMGGHDGGASGARWTGADCSERVRVRPPPGVPTATMPSPSPATGNTPSPAHPSKVGCPACRCRCAPGSRWPSRSCECDGDSVCSPHDNLCVDKGSPLARPTLPSDGPGAGVAAAIGIGVCVVVLLPLVIIGAWCYFKRRAESGNLGGARTYARMGESVFDEE